MTMLPEKRTETRPVVQDPFDEFERMARDMLSWATTWRMPSIDGFQTALGELEETDDAFVVEVDLPGVDRKDIDIELEGRRLIVTAERKERERTGILRRRTRTVGTYRHEVVVPTDVDEDAVEASLSDGVLTVRLPKHESARRRRIKVA